MSVINITNKNYHEEVVNSNQTVLLDFWASWCGPCSMLSPVIDEIAGDRTDVKVGKVNVDEEPELSAAFQIMSIPTVIVLKGGNVTGKSVGVRPREDIEAMLG